MRKILLALVMMLCLTRAALAGETVLLDGGADGYPGVTLYRGPSAYSDAVGYVYGGTEAEVLDRGSGFVHVRVGQMSGWAAKSQVAETTAAVENGHCPKDTDILVQVPGGKLYVRVTDNTVILTGKVQQVFEAEAEY